jgi:hypothetical protein
VKPNQVNIVPFAVLRNLEQVQYAEKPGFPRELMSDVRQPNRLDREDLDFAVVHAVSAAHRDVRARPDPHGTGDLSAADAFTESLRKHHVKAQATARTPARLAMCQAGVEWWKRVSES